MSRYKVKRPYIAKNGEFIEPGHILNEFHEGKFLDGLLKHDFVEEIKEEIPKFGVIAYSRLVNLEIADIDYTEGDRKQFTYDEALKIEKRLKESGWRLPTRSEWVILCEEFGQDEKGELSSEKLTKNLKLETNGLMYPNGDNWYAGRGGDYWSRSAGDANGAYHLVFNPIGVNPSHYANRYLGFSLRFVRDRA